MVTRLVSTGRTKVQTRGFSLIGKKHANEWSHIILDEVHEREEDLDLFAFFFYVFIQERKTLQVGEV